MNKRRTWGPLALLFTLVGIWLFCVSALPTVADSPQAPLPADPAVELVQSDAEAILLSVDLGDPAWQQIELEGAAYDELALDGFVSTTEAGAPQIPTRRVLLGIPLGASYEVRVSVAESAPLPGEYHLPPAPSPVRNQVLDPEDPFGALTHGGEWAYVQDEALYAADAFYPSSLASVADEGFIRNQRFIALQLYPVQYNPATGQALFNRSFTVEVRLSYPQGDRSLGARQSAGQFEDLLASTLLNYEAARNWRGIEPLDVEWTRAVPTADPSYKILVDQDGIYQVTRAELEAAGIPVNSIDPATFKVYYQGQEIPIRVFETGGVLDELWFYGQQETTKFTATNVYWLTYGGDPGQRMAPVSAPLSATVPISTHFATTLLVEEDHDYRSSLPWSSASDHWLWDYTFYPSTKPILDFDTTLHQPITGGYSATLKVAMVGYNAIPGVTPDHCVRTSLNGQLLDEHFWDGNLTQQNLSLAFDAPLLLDGLNTIRVEGCTTAASYDITYYDWFEVDFRRAFQAVDDSLLFDVPQPGWQYQLAGFVTDTVEIFDVSQVYSAAYLVDFTVALSGSDYAATFFDASALAGDRYLALTHDQLKSPVAIVEDQPSTLADPANHADYIVVAPSEFFTDIQPLVDHRTAEGLDVVLADLEDVYDEFNFGVLSPEAIRDFLSYAYHTWTSPAPTYVLLVGDGHFDFKNYNNLGRPNLLPPYLHWVDPWLGETAADNQYVAVAGADVMPDMLLGRLPAETAADLQVMVGKTLSYEVSPVPGNWNQNVVFVSDDYPDTAGNFYAASNDLVNNYLPASYTATLIYEGQTCPKQTPIALECRQDLLDNLDITGTLLVNYIGHAGTQIWTGERLWQVSDIPSLAPNDRFPIILPMTCLEGSFHRNDYDAMSEEMVRVAGKGAVASWGPTGEGVVHGHDYLNKGFFDAIFKNGVREIGFAVYEGKLRLYTSGSNLDQVDTYHLFGEPALHVNALDADLRAAKSASAGEVMPGDLLTYTLTFSNAGPGTAYGVVLTDRLPADFVDVTVVYSSSEVISQQAGMTYTWTISDLPPGASGEIWLRGTVDSAAQPPFDLVNQIEIGAATPIISPGASSGSVVIPVVEIPSADLVVSKRVEAPTQVWPGVVLTYTLAFTNMGEGTATGVVLTDYLPVDLLDVTVVYSSPEVIAQQPGLTFTWTISDLVTGASGEIRLRGRIDPDAQPPFDLVNTVEIWSQTPELAPGTNVDSVTTPVSNPAFHFYLPLVTKSYS